MLNYDYVIIGAGISGCSVAYELSKHSQSVLLLDKEANVASGASGAAGAFLSPLLGKANSFKDLVTTSLKYSTEFYKKNFPNYINNCGTTRIPQNEEDNEKFKNYIPHMDFDYSKENDGYFFKIGSVVDSFNMCVSMIESCEDLKTRFNYEVITVEYKNNLWIINNEIEAKNIVFTTGSEVSLIDQFYLKIRPVWGQRIDVSTTTEFSHNYHKACSISQSKVLEKGKYIVSIGATHHRDEKSVQDKDANTAELLSKANEITKINDVNILNHYVGARACSNDYFPVVGTIIDSKRTLEEFPYLVKGTNVEPKRFTRYSNAYVLTGVGGRGYVLAPYLANELVNNIIYSNEINENVTIDRLFKREVKRIK